MEPEGPPKSLQGIEAGRASEASGWVQHVAPTGGRDLRRPDLRPLPLSRPPAARQGRATKDGIAAARAGTSLVQY